MTAVTKTMFLCCSVLKPEMEALARQHWPEHPRRYLSSMLHIHPQRLASALAPAVEEELRQGHRVVLIYGDCCAQMADLEARSGVVRTRGVNCCELLLGHETYLRGVRDGAFFLIPEWAHRWREIFADELGLNQANATNLMQDMHRKLVFLDSGIVPVPKMELRECSAYCGLPCEVMPVSLEPLRIAIDNALLEQEAGSCP